MDEEKLTKAEQERIAAKKTGAIASRAAADYFTAGKYENIRNKPVVGEIVQDVEDKIGDKIEARDMATGGRLGRMTRKLEESGTLDNADKAMNSISRQRPSSPSKSMNNPSDNKAKSNSGTNDKPISANLSSDANDNSQQRISVPIKKAMIKIALILIPIFILIFIIFYIVASIASLGEGGLATGGYYAMRCPEVTVIMTDKSNNYATTDTKTYALEDYVAGVVAAEVGMFNNLEVYKEFAILARSYFLTHDDNCTIESSDRKQVFRDITAKSTSTEQLIYQAVEETKGKVLLKDNELISSQYDAFACIAEDNNYYTISQANQRIPKTWINSRISKSSQPDWFICNGKENLKNHHGEGVSQYGSMYLASEMNYKYDEILAFYLGDDITISRGGFMSSIAGLEIKDTTNSTPLLESLASYLAANGSSIEEFNAYIMDNVKENGAGTREGVVTAAVSFVNFLYDGGGVRIPYLWGGHYQKIGVNPYFGATVDTTVDIYGRSFGYSGLDCSGFVSWAIRNGGYNISRHTTATFDDDFSSDSCYIGSDSCIGQPGDLINSASCHVQMIVAVDEANSVYYVAESTGSYGVIMRAVSMYQGNCGSKPTKILYMDNFYNNSMNKDYSY